MYFNSDVRKLLAQMEAANVPALNRLPLEEARRAYQEVGEQLGDVPVPVERIDDFNPDGPAGRLPLRMYRPYGLSENPAPALIYFHGGGWTLGSIQTHDKVCRRIADQAKCVVISVEYRLAPAFPLPAASHDAIAAVSWISGKALEFNINANRLAVGGDSAGGGLAAIAAIAAKDMGIVLCAQVLLYPCLDNRDSAWEYHSRKQNAQVPPLSHDVLEWFIRQYRPDPKAAEDWKVSALLAPTLSGVAATFLAVGDRDPFHSEGMLYAERLRQSEVDIISHSIPGMIHGFIEMAGVLNVSREVFKQVAFFLQQQFVRSRTEPSLRHVNSA